MLLIFHALEAEIAPLRRRCLDDPRRATAAEPYGTSGILSGLEVTFVRTGVGPRATREVVTRTLARYRPPLWIISTGVAGALSPHLPPGSILLADRLLVDQQQQLQAIAPRQSDLEIADTALTRAAVPFVTGTLYTSPRVLPDRKTKARARAVTGATAVDMESAVIAELAQERGDRFICVRAILDKVEERLPPPGIINAQGQVRFARLIGSVLREPSLLVLLPQMRARLNRASRALATAICALAAQISTVPP